VCVCIAGVDHEAFQMSRFGIGLRGQLVGMSQAKLMELQLQRSSGLILQRHLISSSSGLVGFQVVLFRGLGNPEHSRRRHIRRSALASGRRLRANNQGALLSGGDAPMRGTGGAQAKVRAVKWLEAPKTT